MKNTERKTKSIKNIKIGSLFLKFKKPKAIAVSAGLIAVFVLGGLYLAKGFFVAAVVNGMPISRLSVIRQLERQQGRQTLEFIIDKKLIDAELNKQKLDISAEEIDIEIKKIEAQVVSQGATFDAVLAEQGLTKDSLREQIVMQKKLEKLLADKLVITDTEIDTYIKDSKLTPPKDMSNEDFRKQISEQLRQQKFQQEAQKWMSELTKGAKIEYYVNY